MPDDDLVDDALSDNALSDDAFSYSDLASMPPLGPHPPRLPLLIGIAFLLILSGCSAVKRVGMEMVTDDLAPAPRTFLDIAYVEDENAFEKQRLDLYLPSAEVPGFPMMVFVHGGGFDTGDRGFEVGGLRIYENVGRYYADRGIGVAVISYRLQPDVDWSEQLDDVGRAVAWVAQEAPGYGASPTLVVAGHSAGAFLVARLAVDRDARARYGLGAGSVDGVIAVSGAGYDLEDETTWTLDADLEWSESRFSRGEVDSDWQRDASVIPLIGPDLPPFLLLHTRDEWVSLARQNELLHRALRAAGGEVSLVAIEDSSHARMVLRLARTETVLSRLIEDFVKNLNTR